MTRWLAITLALLAGCSRSGSESNAATPPPNDLERAAIATGVIPDPESTDITGFYSRETDSICVVPSVDAFRIGVTVDYGDTQNCSGSGKVTRDGETLHVAMDDAAGCAFDARFEGDRIVFPGRLPSACGKLCTGRATMTAIEADQLSESTSEAATMRDARGRLLCGAG